MSKDLIWLLKEYLIEKSVDKNHYPYRYWIRNKNLFIHITFWIWSIWALLSIFAIFSPINNSHKVGRLAVVAFESAFQYIARILNNSNAYGQDQISEGANLSPAFWNYEAYLFLFVTLFLLFFSIYSIVLIKRFCNDLRHMVEQSEKCDWTSSISAFSKNIGLFWWFCVFLTIWTTYSLLYIGKPVNAHIGTWLFLPHTQTEKVYFRDLTVIGKITGFLNVISAICIIFLYFRYCRELFSGNVFFFKKFRFVFENKKEVMHNSAIQESIVQSFNVSKNQNFFRPNSPGYVAQLRNVNKYFEVSGGHFHALKNINLDIKVGEFVVILGYSGSGKTTLLNLLAGIDRPTSGECIIDNCNTSLMTNSDLNFFRRQKIGYIFQNYALLPNLSAKENIAITRDMDSFSFRFKLKKLIFDLKSANKGSEKVESFINFLKSIFISVSSDDELFYFMDSLDLINHKDKLPHQLSGGQQQRVAISRALIKKPKILLADEPTGAIDHSMTKSILELFYSINKYAGVTVILITHNPLIAKMAKRVLHVSGGEIVKDVFNEHPQHPKDIKGL